MPVTRVFKIVYSTGELVEFTSNALIPESELEQKENTSSQPRQGINPPPASVNPPVNVAPSSQGVRTQVPSQANQPSYYNIYKPVKKKEDLKKATFIVGGYLGAFRQRLKGYDQLQLSTSFGLNSAIELGGLFRLNDAVVLSTTFAYDIRSYNQQYTLPIDLIDQNNIVIQTIEMTLDESQALIYTNFAFMLGSFITSERGPGAVLPMVGLSYDVFLGGSYTVEGEWTGRVNGNLETITISEAGGIERGVYNARSQNGQQYLKGFDVALRAGLMILTGNVTAIRFLYSHGLTNVFPGVVNVSATVPNNSNLSIRNQAFNFSFFYRF